MMSSLESMHNQACKLCEGLVSAVIAVQQRQLGAWLCSYSMRTIGLCSMQRVLRI